MRSAGVFQGYYKQPEASRAALTEDGWLRTGDAGFIDRRGHLVIVDRARDVGKLADGSALAPQFIENKLKFSPYIGEAVVFGDGRPFVAAIVAIDPATVGNWAERQNLAYTSFQDLAARRRGARADPRRDQRSATPACRTRSASAASSCSTRNSTPTTTRSPGPARSAAALSPRNTPRSSRPSTSGADEVEVSAAITYEDGRKAVLRSTIAIGDVDERRDAGRGAPHRAREAGRGGGVSAWHASSSTDPTRHPGEGRGACSAAPMPSSSR